MTPVSEIKLIRTDTTLDLSQKAEKVWAVMSWPSKRISQRDLKLVGLTHNLFVARTNIKLARVRSLGILTWRGRGSCSPKRVINKARRLIEYTALHAAVCGRLWLQLRLYVRRRIFARVGLCACRRPRTQLNSAFV